MPVAGLNHIGIAVHSIAEQRAYYESTLGLEFEGSEEVRDQQVQVAFFKAGSVRIELLQPISDDSPLTRFLDKRGEGLHHVAYSVENLDTRIAELKKSGFQMIDESPRRGSNEMRVAFVHPRSTYGVLTELCEE